MNQRKITSVILVFIITVSLVWCVDFDSLSAPQIGTITASQDGNAQTPQNKSTTSSDKHSDDCLCICHVPYVEYTINLLDSTPAVDIVFAYASSFTLSVPNRTLYRPPISA